MLIQHKWRAKIKRRKKRELEEARSPAGLNRRREKDLGNPGLRAREYQMLGDGNPEQLRPPNGGVQPY